jgi:hypothetical protein
MLALVPLIALIEADEPINRSLLTDAASNAPDRIRLTIHPVLALTLHPLYTLMDIEEPAMALVFMVVLCKEA